jgi:hypothetical protein
MGRDKKKNFGAVDPDQPLWARIVLPILKNLVYIFAAIIAGSFLAMFVMMNTESSTNWYKVWENTGPTTVNVTVHPLFRLLEKNMDLEQHTVSILDHKFQDAGNLNRQYVSKNKAAVMPKMAGNWPAL